MNMGIDIAGKKGSSVLAAADGNVYMREAIYEVMES